MTARYQSSPEDVSAHHPTLTGQTPTLTDPAAPAPEATSMWMPRPPSTNAIHDTAHAENIVDTLTNGAGNRIDPYSAKGGDFVRVGGMTTTVDVAIQQGLLRRTADGIVPGPVSVQDYTGGKAAPQADDKAPQAPQAPVNPAPLSRGAEAVLADLRAKVGATEIAGLMAGLVDGREMNQFALNTLASNLGVLPDEARAIVDSIADAYADQARRYTASKGVDEGLLPLFVDFAQERHQMALRDAGMRQALHGDLSGLDSIIKDFKANLDTLDPASILSAKFGSGITAQIVNGRLVLNVPGHGQMLYSAAVRAGIVSVD